LIGVIGMSVLTTVDKKHMFFYSRVLKIQKIINDMSIFVGGDMATTRRYLDMAASRVSSTIVNSDTSITPININCLDPLGRSALLIGSYIYQYYFFYLFYDIFLLLAIEYENIEMIELLLNYNVDTGEALLHAIDEEFVEGKIDN